MQLRVAELAGESLEALDEYSVSCDAQHKE